MINIIKKYIKGLSEKFRIVQWAYLYIHKKKVKSRIKLDDNTFATVCYEEKMGKELNLLPPVTFDEKLWWLKFHYHNPLMTICADKYKVREYIISCGEGHILNELYGVYKKAEEIDLKVLPDEFFLKTNHGCGDNFWCHDKKTFPINQIRKKLKKALAKNYYYESREWPYKNIKPLILAEKVLKPSEPSELIDYRFLCFNGKCKYLFVDVETCAEDGSHKSGAKRNVYDRDGNFLLVKVTRDNFPKNRVEIPDNFIEMRRIAEKLSRPFPFVRVDLYSFDKMIRFGEMTFFHAGGVNMISPDSFQNTLGDCIELPNDCWVK